MAKPVWTDEQVLNQLNSGKLWPGSTISYSFPQLREQLHFEQGEGPGFIALNAYQQDHIRLALAIWDELIVPNMVEGAVTTSDIEFGNTTTGIAYAHAYFPTVGSVWFNTNYPDVAIPVVGEYGFTTYLHEIGHSIGLEHMGDYNGSDDDGPSSWQDSSVYSIMSYYGPHIGRGKGDVAWGDWLGPNGQMVSPQTPMLNDIMAIQVMYGAAQTRTEDTVYGFGSNVTGVTASIYDFTQNTAPVMTLYDAGGIDTLNLSGWSSESHIDLRPGQFSSVNTMTNNLAIAHNVIIENAVTGAGNDSIHVNSANNYIDGGAGADVAVFSGNANTYRFDYSLSSREYTVVDTIGTDATNTLLNIERAAFADRAESLNDLTPGVYRFYNTQTGNHFFTANNDEATTVAGRAGFSFEGKAFVRNVFDDSNSVLVHRFWNDATGTHFYTANASEATDLREAGNGFSYEGVAYRGFSQKTADTTELYRFYNKETGSHFYTADIAEMENVKVNLAGQYNFEGVAYYVEVA